MTEKLVNRYMGLAGHPLTIKFAYQEFRTMAFVASKIHCVVNMLKATYVERGQVYS